MLNHLQRICQHGKPIPGGCLACEKGFDSADRLRLFNEALDRERKHLRRINAELLAALVELERQFRNLKYNRDIWPGIGEAHDAARAAIAKAKGEQP